MWPVRVNEWSLRADALRAERGDVSPEWLVEVPRVAASELSVEAFRSDWMRRQVPFIVENVCSDVGDKWGEFEKVCAGKTVGVYRAASAEATDTLGVVSLMQVNELLRSIRQENQQLYMFDVPIVKLPAFAELLQIPPYVEHCFLHRTMRDHPFKRSWPTLFVGAKGTNSPTHLDRWHGHFWMTMLEGTKQWTVWHADDSCLLNPDFSTGKFDPDFPPVDRLLKSCPAARSITFQLKKGETLFVPGGSVHAVCNVEHSMAVAGNFVDETNLKQTLEDLKQTAGRYQDNALLYEALSEMDFDEDDDE